MSDAESTDMSFSARLRSARFQERTKLILNCYSTQLKTLNGAHPSSKSSWFLKIGETTMTYLSGKGTKQKRVSKKSSMYLIKGVKGWLRRGSTNLCYALGIEVCQPTDRKQSVKGDSYEHEGLHINGACKGDPCIIRQAFGGPRFTGQIKAETKPVVNFEKVSAEYAHDVQVVKMGIESRHQKSFDGRSVQDFKEHYLSGSFEVELDISDTSLAVVGMLLESLEYVEALGRGGTSGYGKVDFLTPIVSTSTHFYRFGCMVMATKVHWRYLAKAQTALLPAYTGTLEVRVSHNDKSWLRKKLYRILYTRQFGRFQAEGLGKINWTDFWVQNAQKQAKQSSYTHRPRICKGLPTHLPSPLKELIRYGLLHDFYHCPKLTTQGMTVYPSKIYYEPKLEDLELMQLLRDSHKQSDHLLVTTFQPYDHWAAALTRKRWMPTPYRYNFSWEKDRQPIDFEQLADTIAQVVNTRSVHKLYEYIYRSKELDLLTESMSYGFNSLKEHLLLVANLMLRDHRWGKLHGFIQQYQHGSRHTGVEMVAD